jgi:hypothetical protein
VWRAAGSGTAIPPLGYVVLNGGDHPVKNVMVLKSGKASSLTLKRARAAARWAKSSVTLDKDALGKDSSLHDQFLGKIEIRLKGGHGSGHVVSVHRFPKHGSTMLKKDSKGHGSASAKRVAKKK